MEILEAFNKMRLTDTGNLLLMFRAADLAKLAIEERDSDSLVFLMQSERLIPFGYALRLKPLPYSERLHNDIYNLVQSHYLERKSPVYITGLGSDWVKGLLERYLYTEDILNPVVDALRNFMSHGKDGLFRLVYAKITQ